MMPTMFRLEGEPAPVAGRLALLAIAAATTALPTAGPITLSWTRRRRNAHFINICPRFPSMVQDPVCKMELDPADSAAEIEFDGVTYYFCSPSCAKDFKAKPETFVQA